MDEFPEQQMASTAEWSGFPPEPAMSGWHLLASRETPGFEVILHYRARPKVDDIRWTRHRGNTFYTNLPSRIASLWSYVGRVDIDPKQIGTYDQDVSAQWSGTPLVGADVDGWHWLIGTDFFSKPQPDFWNATLHEWRGHGKPQVASSETRYLGSCIIDSTCAEPAKPTTHPLSAFADRWMVEGDYVLCHGCRRSQQVSWMLHRFPHASGCEMANLPNQRPWVELHSLLGAALSKAKPMSENENA